MPSVRYHLADVPLNIDPDEFTPEIKGKVDRPTNLEVVNNNLHRLPLGGLHRHATARAGIQEGFLAGRSDER